MLAPPGGLDRVSYSSPPRRAAAIVIQQSAAGCGSAASCNHHQNRDEDETYGIKPIIVCAHAGMVAPAQRGSISAAGRLIADEIDEAGQIFAQLSADCLVGELASRVEHVAGARNLHPAAEPGTGSQRPQDRKP